MASELFRTVGPYRLLTPEGVREASEAILRMDPAAMSFWFPAIVVMKNKVGWAWRVFSDGDVKLKENVLKSIGKDDQWALLKAPESVTSVIDETERRLAAEAEAKARAERARLEDERKSAERRRLAVVSALGGAAVGAAFFGWKRLGSRRILARS